MLQEPISRSPCALLKVHFLTNAMHLLYALVGKCSFSKAQGFVKPAPGVRLTRRLKFQERNSHATVYNFTERAYAKMVLYFITML